VFQKIVEEWEYALISYDRKQRKEKAKTITSSFFSLGLAFYLSNIINSHFIVYEKQHRCCLSYF
jgi:hypothetical protein